MLPKYNENRLAALLEPQLDKDEDYAEMLAKAAEHYPSWQVVAYIAKHPPSPRVIYLLMVKAQQGLQSQNARKRASAPRKKEDQTTALKLWEVWQAQPNTYPNKQQFIADITLKCYVSQNTARRWFDKFRVSASAEWEATYGRKYPNL